MVKLHAGKWRGKSGAIYNVMNDIYDNPFWPFHCDAPNQIDKRFWMADGTAWTGHEDGGDDLVAAVHAFKVGDRVRAKRDINGFFDEGEIYQIAIVNNDRFVLTDEEQKDIKNAKHHTDLEWLLENFEPVAATPQPQLTIQTGKFYKTRDERKVGPATEYGFWDDGYPFEVAFAHWVSASGVSQGDNRDHDLIAEWVDEPVAPIAEQPAAKPKFKVGDRVRLNVGYWREEGYEIKKIDGDKYFLDDTRGGSHPYSFNPEWVLASGPATIVTSTPAIVCLMESGRPLPAERPHVHPSTSAAEREAARLADKYKGKEFAVFELGSSCRKEPDFKRGDLVTFHSPAMVTGVDKKMVNIQTDGGNYTIP